MSGKLMSAQTSTLFVVLPDGSDAVSSSLLIYHIKSSSYLVKSNSGPPSVPFQCYCPQSLPAIQRVPLNRIRWSSGVSSLMCTISVTKAFFTVHRHPILEHSKYLAPIDLEDSNEGPSIHPAINCLDSDSCILQVLHCIEFAFYVY